MKRGEKMNTNRNKKKIFTLLICIVLIFGIPTHAFAEETILVENDRPCSVTISERDIIKTLQAKTDDDLRLMGYSSEEISTLRGITDEAVVSKIRTQSDEQLRKQGLTKTQIEIIRNETNIQKAAEESFGKVTYTIDSVSYKYVSPNTILTVLAEWNWESEPLFLFTDIIACTTSESGFTMTSATGTANYRIAKGGSVKEYAALPVKTESSGTGTYAKIDLSKTYTRAARPTKMIAFDGSITTTFKASKRIASVGISSKYGHSTITLNPSVSFGNEGATISFSPSEKVETGTEAYKRLEL